MSCCAVLRVGAARTARRSQAAALLGQAAHQVQHAVDDAPGEVAAECADEHRADVLPPGLRDAERSGEGQHHDQAEQHLGRRARSARGRAFADPGSWFGRRGQRSFIGRQDR